VRNYVRKTTGGAGCTEDQRREARNMIAAGLSMRRTAESIGIPFTTLRENLKRVGILHFSLIVVFLINYVSICTGSIYRIHKPYCICQVPNLLIELDVVKY